MSGRDTVDTASARHGGGIAIWDGRVFGRQPPGADWFDPEALRARDALLSSAAGRGAAYFFRAMNEAVWVLRHYRRGGLLAHLNPDRYLWTGDMQTRPVREFRLLAALYERGLPVPKPVAARAVYRAGLGYGADLITWALPNTEPLADRLGRTPMPAAGWHTLGGEIAALHRAGVWHADLNARNILTAGNDRFYLIDFDRARFRGAGSWRQANLARLRRSLDKFAARGTRFHFGEADWQALRTGYRVAFGGL